VVLIHQFLRDVAEREVPCEASEVKRKLVPPNVVVTNIGSNEDVAVTQRPHTRALEQLVLPLIQTEDQVAGVPLVLTSPFLCTVETPT
jgi:hypothetical protein